MDFEILDEDTTVVLILDLHNSCCYTPTSRPSLIYQMKGKDMTVTVAQQATPVAREQLTVEEQRGLAHAAGAALEMLASRLAANDGFAEEFAAHPKSALGGAGIVLQKEGIEFLMMHDPARFDMLTDRLFGLMAPDTLTSLVGPSCEMTD